MTLNAELWIAQAIQLAILVVGFLTYQSKRERQMMQDFGDLLELRVNAKLQGKFDDINKRITNHELGHNR